MSRYILTSFENSASSFKSLEDLSLSGDFYDTIYSGRFFSRYSVLCNGVESYIYIVKSYSDELRRFVRDVETIVQYKNSPFADFIVKKAEMLCYDGNKEGVFYDVVIASRLPERGMFANIANEMFSEAKLLSLLRSVLWLLHNDVVLDKFTINHIKLYCDEVYVDFSVRDVFALTHVKYREENEQEFVKLLIYVVLLAYYITFNPSYDKKIDIDEMIDDCDNPIADSLKDRVSLLSCDNVHIEKLINIIVATGSVVDISEVLSSLEAIYRDVVSGSTTKYTIQKSDFYDSRLYEIVEGGRSEMISIVRDRESGKLGYIDRYGDAITPIIFTSAEKFYESIAVVELDGCFNAITNTGEYLFDKFCHHLKWCGPSNRFIAIISGICCLVDREGVVLGSEGFYRIHDFSCGYAVFEDFSGKKGYLDTDGVELCYMRFDDAKDFSDGIGQVTYQGDKYYVTVDGEVLKCP